MLSCACQAHSPELRLPETCSGAALFFHPEMSFPRPRDWSILFSAAACLFFDLQLFLSPAMRPRKRAQSFFQPLCIILSSLFLGPKTSCSEPRIFFRTPRHLVRRDAHTRQDEKQIANQKLGKLGNKSQARKNKRTKLHATDNKKSKTFFTHNKEKATRKALQGRKSDENKLKGATRKGQQEQTLEQEESHTKSASGG